LTFYTVGKPFTLNLLAEFKVNSKHPTWAPGVAPGAFLLKEIFLDKIEFPKFVYHKTLKPKVIKTKEEFESLGEEWQEVPFSEEESEESEEIKPKRSKKAKDE
jgi:hypothetical protein